MSFEFEWDDRKAEANLKKHGVGFDEALTVFRRLLSEAAIEFDYSRSRANRFASKLGPQTVAVVLEPDVAQVFDSSRSVSKLLRSVIAAVPRADQVHRAGRRKAV